MSYELWVMSWCVGAGVTHPILTPWRVNTHAPALALTHNY